MPTRLLLALWMLIAGAAAQAASFEAEVTFVTDGDSIWIRAPGEAPQALRIRGIDAPEICQAFGREARAALAAQVLHRQVRVRPAGHDDYGRLLGQVRSGRSDVGAWLVAQGFAWSHDWHRKPGPYARLQAQAQQARRGLWAEAAPVEPRSFRRQHGRCEH